MYELVKKKSFGIKILSGIAIFFVVTQVLKLAFAEPELSINDELMKMVSEINKHAPVIVDSTTRFDNAMALPGNRLQYNYTLLNHERSEIDSIYLVKEAKKELINKIKTDPKAAYFRDNDVDISASYSDKNGAYICRLYISHTEYK